MQVLRKSFIASLLFFWIPPSLFAQSLTIQVNDQSGNPLSDAVVEITNPTNASDQRSELSKIAIMDQINKRFVPTLLVVTEGQSVQFPNSDNIRHHVYSFSKAKPFELKLYAGKPENPITFDHHGVVLLGCNIHDSMVGNIYVANNTALVTNTNGKVQFQSKSNINQISVWHPLQSTNPEQRLKLDVSTLQQNSNGIVTVSIAVEAPALRDTFADTYQ